jgi:hypothetical protein
VETYWDALVFVSTCLSVGYADVFARTPAGKAIAAAVMTLGPAMSGAMLDPARAAGCQPDTAGEADKIGRRADGTPALSPSESIAVQRIIVDKLEAILVELRALRAEA